MGEINNREAEESDAWEETFIFRGETFIYSFSDSLSNVKATINRRMGTAIQNLGSIDNKNAWIGTSLGEELIIVMDKRNFKYSMTIYTEDKYEDIKYCDIFRRIDNFNIYCPGIIFRSEFFALELLEEHQRLTVLMTELGREKKVKYLNLNFTLLKNSLKKIVSKSFLDYKEQHPGGNIYGIVLSLDRDTPHISMGIITEEHFEYMRGDEENWEKDSFTGDDFCFSVLEGSVVDTMWEWCVIVENDELTVFNRTLEEKFQFPSSPIRRQVDLDPYIDHFDYIMSLPSHALKELYWEQFFKEFGEDFILLYTNDGENSFAYDIKDKAFGYHFSNWLQDVFVCLDDIEWEDADYQEETITLRGYEKPLTYFLSNNLVDIKVAIETQMPSLSDLDSIDNENAWDVNTRLSEEVKAMMISRGVEYSATICQDNILIDGKILMVNRHIDNDWLFCSGRIYRGHFYTTSLLEDRKRLVAVIARDLEGFSGRQ